MASEAGPDIELSILMPVYNEERTVVEAIRRVEKTQLGVSYELVIVDDGSKDRSRQLIEEQAASNPSIRLVVHDVNQGKGAAVRTALDAARGRFGCIYDADLEYDPGDIVAVVEPVMAGDAEVCFGVRSFGGHAAHSYAYVLGNRFLTFTVNAMFNRYVRDMMTCYKAMSIELFRSLDLTSRGFELESEITGKLMKRGFRIYEVPISYHARTHEEGKKIRPTDAITVIKVLAKLRLGRAA